MVERAAAALGFDPARSWIVGDHGSDLHLGRAVGARTILVRTGHGEEELERGAAEDADHVVADLLAAASVIRDDLLPERSRNLSDGPRSGGLRDQKQLGVQP
jgi:D-glycero-D-manno-heptose 1,7-bisphosphate phosphatase